MFPPMGLPMGPPPGMPPPGMGMPPPGAGMGGPPPGLLAMLSGLGQGGLPQPPGTPSANPMGKMADMAAGAGLNTLMATFTKLMKIMSTTGGRSEKSVRVPMAGNSGPMDEMASQQMAARQGMPGPGAMPLQGPANLPMRIGPM